MPLSGDRQTPEITRQAFNTAIIRERQSLPLRIRDNRDVLMALFEGDLVNTEMACRLRHFSAGKPAFYCALHDVINRAFPLSLSCFLMASTVLIFSHEITNDSNSSVYRLPGPAQGTGRV